VGARSSFEKCYNPATNEITDGVWTGKLTNTTAPAGYVEPDACTGSQYSECDTDDDCILEISPLCACYVSSSSHPFDPCKEHSTSTCNTDNCTGEECDDHEAICIQGSGGMGGTCKNEWYGEHGSFEVLSSTAVMSGMCASNNQCNVKIRSKAPWPAIGVDLCGCYASSALDPFDECEGEDRCYVARCREHLCDEFEAYCEVSPNDNGMGDCVLRSTSENDKLEVA